MESSSENLIIMKKGCIGRSVVTTSAVLIAVGDFRGGVVVIVVSDAVNINVGANVFPEGVVETELVDTFIVVVFFGVVIVDVFVDVVVVVVVVDGFGNPLPHM